MKDKARNRNISVNMYFDDKFRELSPLKPSAQALFIYLLTCPYNGSIPGLYRAGKAAMAEELEWSIEEFDTAFNEIEFAGMVKADWKNKLVFIPRMIKYNKPSAPNTVISWKKEWDSLQNCALKKEAYELLKSFCKDLGVKFIIAFEKAISKP